MAHRLISPARRASDRERLVMLPQPEKAARILAKASKVLTKELDLVAEHETDRDAYVVCVLEQLHRALNRREVFAAPSNRWADPRPALDGPRWQAMRSEVLAGLCLTEDAGEHLSQLTRGWTRRGGRWPTVWRRPAPTRRGRSSSAEGGGRARLSVDKLARWASRSR